MTTAAAAAVAAESEKTRGHHHKNSYTYQQNIWSTSLMITKIGRAGNNFLFSFELATFFLFAKKKSAWKLTRSFIFFRPQNDMNRTLNLTPRRQRMPPGGMKYLLICAATTINTRVYAKIDAFNCIYQAYNCPFVFLGLCLDHVHKV